MVKPKRKPHRYIKKKPIYKSKFLWFSVLSLIVLYAIFYLLFLVDYFQIKEIKVNGLNKILEEELEFSIRLKLENKILIFPNRNIFIVNLKKIKESILQEYILLDSITIKRKLPSSLIVLGQEREGLATFCFEDYCFSIDKKGIVFELDNKVRPLIKTLSLQKELVLGEDIILKEDLSLILKIQDYIQNSLDIEVEEFLICSKEKLVVQMKEGWEARFNLEEDIDWQLIKLQVLLNEKIEATSRENLEWIELRYGNFANPKYKE